MARTWAAPLMALALGLSACGSGGPSAAPGTTGATATSARPAAPTVSAAPGTTGRTDTGPESFLSPTRNIGCHISRDNARCDIREHDWKAPPKPSSCDLDWGSYLGVSGPGPGVFRCVGDTAIAASSDVLPYGSVARRGAYECRSQESGMECVNLDTGHGIAVSRSEYKLL